MSDPDLLKIQTGLKGLGYDPGPLDGLRGPKTRAAGSQAVAADFARKPATARPVAAGDELPWMAEARRVMGLHEARNNTALREFLSSDGATLGDPAQLPWCGDFVQTCIRLTLPTEAFPGDLGRNPYWARNWLLFGGATEPTYGAVLVFSRDGGGHVGFCAGGDSTSFRVLGGNQSNTVSITTISRTRFLGARWPLSYPRRPINLPRQSGGALSTNEA